MSRSFQGSILLGMGFTFDDVNAAKGKASPLADMRNLIESEPCNAEAIKPYLGGEEVNNSPTHAHHRYAIDLSALTYAQARDRYPALLSIVATKVRPERDRLGSTSVDARRKMFWWQYGSPASQLYHAIQGQNKVIAINCGATPHVSFAIVDAAAVFANTLAVFAFSTHAAFATLQSRVHEIWARAFASSLEDRLRYTPSDCFETFPLPHGHDDAPALEAAGLAYHDHRAALMIARDQGMTPTYNRFHRRDDDADDIAELRRLHHAMDDAVLRAYGWDDLADRAAPAFLDEASEDDHQYRGRYFWPAAFRDDLLARLLKLNEERAMAERML